MITLRDYQQQGVDDCVRALANSSRKRVVFECPTGGGKTVIFSYIVSRAVEKGSKTLILTDRDELLRGTGGTLENFGITPSYIRAGRKYPPNEIDCNTFVAMAQTLKKRLDLPIWLKWLQAIELVIIDECHKQEFNDFFYKGIFEGKTVIGFSATPKRGGKMRQLGIDYDDIVHTETVLSLIDKGFLMPNMYFGSPLAPDLKGVKMNTKGDYSESGMFERYDTPKLYGGVIDAYKEHTPDTIALVFCTNIPHCVRTCKEFNDAGIPAKFLVSGFAKPKRPDGEEPTNKSKASTEWVRYWEKIDHWHEYNAAYGEYSGGRGTLINEWKNGDFKVMINAGILTTGFDFPAIETVVLFRATVSEVLYLQMLGRGSRPSPETNKTHFNILDFGKNAERLGDYKLERKWTLFHETKKGSGVPPMKECDVLFADKNNKRGCGLFVYASAAICPFCGYVFKKEKEQDEIKLELLQIDNKGKFYKTKPIYQMNYNELDEYAKANRYKQGWVSVQLFVRGGLEELKKYATFKGYSLGWVTRQSSILPQSVIAQKQVLR